MIGNSNHGYNTVIYYHIPVNQDQWISILIVGDMKKWIPTLISVLSNECTVEVSHNQNDHTSQTDTHVPAQVMISLSSMYLHYNKFRPLCVTKTCIGSHGNDSIFHHEWYCSFSNDCTVVQLHVVIIFINK